MPAVSKAQQRLMGAAEHGADFPEAKKIRASMTHEQMHDFASGSEKGKPEHASKKDPKGKHKPGSKEHRRAFMGAAIKRAHADYQSQYPSQPTDQIGEDQNDNPYNAQSM